jgi:mannose-6-phosphate isomerase-like protein (cupin superfamily)
MALLVAAKDVPNSTSEFGGGIVTLLAYGNAGSLMVGHRPAGYHSIPHVHACEQLNYMMAGELWCFVGDKAMLARKGDFFRIPAMAVHWAWNRGDQTCSVVEAHMPGMHDDPIIAGTGVALFDEGEIPQFSGNPHNIFVDAKVYKVIDVEQYALNAEKAPTPT